MVHCGRERALCPNASSGDGLLRLGQDSEEKALKSFSRGGTSAGHEPHIWSNSLPGFRNSKIKHGSPHPSEGQTFMRVRRCGCG